MTSPELATPESAARWYASLGLRPVAIRAAGEKLFGRVANGKEPIGEGWGLPTVPLKRVLAEIHRKPGRGVGICLGPGAGPDGKQVADIEVDGPEGDASLLRLMGGEIFESLGWQATRGGHLLGIVETVAWARIVGDLTVNGAGVLHVPELPGLEVRIGREGAQFQSVAPPTGGRIWNGIEAILPLPESFYAVLEGIVERRAIQSEDRPIVAPERPTRLATPSDDRARRWFLAGLERESARIAPMPEDSGRRNAINKVAYTFAGHLWTGAFDESDIRAALEWAGRLSRLTPTEVHDTIDEGIKDGRAKPLPLPDALTQPSEWDRWEAMQDKLRGKAHAPIAVGTNGHAVGANGVQTAARTYDYELLRWGRDVKSKKVKWLWQNRVPYSFLTLIAGKTSVGKSFVTLAIAALVTRGGELPDRPGECVDQGNVLYIGEDSHEYVLKPRLDALGADENHYAFMSWEAMLHYQLDDIDMLDAIYHEAKQPLLVVIDPPTNFLGEKDEHKNAQVRGSLMRVAVWAMRYDVAVILITHCNKSIGKGLAAIDRIIGSVAWATTCRVAHMLCPDPEDKSQRLFVPLKSNISKPVMSLAYQIQETADLATVEWLGSIDVDVDQVTSGDEPKLNRGQKAAEWGAELFREKDIWTHDEIIERARIDGISQQARNSREFQALPIDKKGYYTKPDGKRSTVWRVREGANWPGTSSTGENAGTRGTRGTRAGSPYEPTGSTSSGLEESVELVELVPGTDSTSSEMEGTSSGGRNSCKSKRGNNLTARVPRVPRVPVLSKEQQEARNKAIEVMYGVLGGGSYDYNRLVVYAAGQGVDKDDLDHALQTFAVSQTDEASGRVSWRIR